MQDHSYLPRLRFSLAARRSASAFFRAALRSASALAFAALRSVSALAFAALRASSGVSASSLISSPTWVEVPCVWNLAGVTRWVVSRPAKSGRWRVYIVAKSVRNPLGEWCSGHTRYQSVGLGPVWRCGCAEHARPELKGESVV